MKSLMRHCRPRDKTTKHSITEEEIKSTLKKKSEQALNVKYHILVTPVINISNFVFFDG